MTALRHTAMLEVNEFLVLDYVHERIVTTRPEIAAALGLSPSSVSRIVRRLVAQKLVNEEPNDGAGERHGGRPRSAITFNSRAGCVLGIDLGGTKCHGVLADLSGSILEEEVRPTNQEGAPYPTLLAVIRELTARADRLDLPVIAIAVGVPAIVDPERGLALGGPNVHWDGFPIFNELASATTVPFVVENDVNLAALAHAWRGNGRGRSDFVTIALGTGIGAAIVADGRLIKGQGSAAGEVGYLVLDAAQLRDERPMSLGAFERLAAGPSIVQRYAAALANSKGPGSRTDAVSTEAVFAMAAAGDPVAASVIDYVVDRVAMAVIALGAVANPGLVILEGSVGRALQPHLPTIMDLVGGQLPVSPEIVTGDLGANATAIGAVAAAVELARNQHAPASFFGTFSVRAGRTKSGVTVHVA